LVTLNRKRERDIPAVCPLTMPRVASSGVATRPLVIAFDVIETLFPLKPLRQRLVAAGQPGQVLELWFSTLLRDAFALVASSILTRMSNRPCARPEMPVVA
jgi:hypothetical protein